MSATQNRNGYHLKKTGDRVNELLSRHFVVPDMTDVPDEGTLSWKDGDYIVDFRIGELCRVSVESEYVFYYLYDIRDGKAFWREASSVDLSNYYTRNEIDEKLAQISISGGGVEILTPDEYAEKAESGLISDNTIYFLMLNGEAQSLYIGSILIAHKGDVGDLGFPYSFPLVF